MRFAAFALGILLTGCFPVMAHPTRVEPGLRLTPIASIALIVDSSGAGGPVTHAVVPSLDFEASLAVRDSFRVDGPGLRLSAAAGMSGYGGAAYAELPRDQFGDFDVGVGLAAHRGALKLWTPYVQFGRHEAEDMSWFLRNGIAFAAPLDSARWSVLWIPTVGVARHRSNRIATLFLSAVIGRQQDVDRPCFFDCQSAFVRTQVMLGSSLSFTLMTPYRPDRR